MFGLQYVYGGLSPCRIHHEQWTVRIANKDACMECGACAMNCPTKALTVQAGVGCAAAVINSALGREGSCCCVIETKNEPVKDQSISCC